MKKYRIELNKNVKQKLVYLIEAKDEDHAKQRAMCSDWDKIEKSDLIDVEREIISLEEI